MRSWDGHFVEGRFWTPLGRCWYVNIYVRMCRYKLIKIQMQRMFIYCYLLYHVKYVDYEVICVYIVYILIYANNVDVYYIYTHILYIFILCKYEYICRYCKYV